MRLVLGSDHAAFDFRQQMAGELRAQGHDVEEVGAVAVESYDYPCAADLTVERVLSGKADFGILMCGSGIGVSIRANRHKGIRAALCTSTVMAELARQHNHANVLCIGARTTEPTLAREIVEVFLRTSPDEGERHVRRVAMLDGSETGC